MAWHFGTYKCGHEGRTQICGPQDDRERKTEYHFATRICKDCWNKKGIEVKVKEIEKQEKSTVA